MTKPRITWAAGLTFLAASLGAASAQQADVVEGAARAIDADIVMVDKQRVILWGVDAPERSQKCRANSREWGCYDAALRTLQNLVGRGSVSCILVGEPDPFNRRYGVCESGGVDIAAEMVRAGMALAFIEQSEDYLDIQNEAIAAEAGLWQVGVEFDEPWAWRKSKTPGGFR